MMMFEAGVHPTLAGVLVGLLTPSREMHSEKSPRAQRYASKLQPFSSLLSHCRYSRCSPPACTSPSCPRR